MMCDTEFECPMCLHAKVAAPEYIDSRLGAIISKITRNQTLIRFRLVEIGNF